MTAPRIFLCAALLALVGCSSSLPAIDPYITFNLVRTVAFPISSSEMAGVDASVTVSGKIDSLNDYMKNHTHTDQLKTSVVTLINLTSSDPAYTLDHLIYARLLIGTDTIGMDSTLFTTTDALTVTHKDITSYMRDTSYPATLKYKLTSVPTNPVTITATMTVIHTAWDTLVNH